MEKIKFVLKILFSIIPRRIISTNYYSKGGVKKKKMINRSSCHYITTCHIKCWIYNLRSAGLLATVKLLRARERLIGRVHSSIHSHLESARDACRSGEKLLKVFFNHCQRLNIFWQIHNIFHGPFNLFLYFHKLEIILSQYDISLCKFPTKFYFQYGSFHRETTYAIIVLKKLNFGRTKLFDHIFRA